MEKRPYRGLDRSISIVGLGAGQVGSDRLSEDRAGRLLNGALDLGVNLIDTARGYGLSEERIGRHLAHRRGEFVLSTKVGYGVAGHEDWTGSCVEAGVERALRIMRTDVLDIVHLHSCPRETLEQGEVIDALRACVDRGLVRIAAYSGDHDALACAIDTGRFGGYMASLNICDQQIIDDHLTRMSGMGFIAKRPLANVAWIHDERPVGQYAEEYWLRLRTMGLDLGDGADETALRFAAYQDGVTCVITGTSKLENLRRNIEIVEKGPLAAERIDEIRRVYQESDIGWVGQV